MRCPKCHNDDTRVLDTRPGGDTFSIKRRRCCTACGFRFSTMELPIHEDVMVEKRDGRVEEFDREKIRSSLQSALKKGSFHREQIEPLVDDIIKHLLQGGRTRITSGEIGHWALEVLKKIDHLAYVRYLSVHQTFKDLNEFFTEISDLD